MWISNIDFLYNIKLGLFLLVNIIGNGVVFINGATIKEASSCTSYPCLIFDEPFDTFDFKTWRHWNTAAATGNNEFQYYANNRSNSFVKEGRLHLKATLTNNTFDDQFLSSGTLDLWAANKCTSNRNNQGCYLKGTEEIIVKPIKSAAITTERSFSFRYGKLEVSAKMPKGDWLWPAVWLMPEHDEYGKWPASGEIDLIESRGNVNLVDDDKASTHVGNKRILQSLHWGPYYPLNGQPYTMAKTNKKTGSFSDSFHKFTLDWTPDSLEFYIDSHCTLNVSRKDQSFWQLAKFPNYLDNPWEGGSNIAPFDKDFSIILNLAVGGTNNYFHPSYKPSPPWKSGNGKAQTEFWNAKDQWLPTWEDPTLQIDYIKVWKKENN